MLARSLRYALPHGLGTHRNTLPQHSTAFSSTSYLSLWSEETVSKAEPPSNSPWPPGCCDPQFESELSLSARQTAPSALLLEIFRDGEQRTKGLGPLKKGRPTSRLTPPRGEQQPQQRRPPPPKQYTSIYSTLSPFYLIRSCITRADTGRRARGSLPQ
jgi:hypothetical protein